MYCERCKYYTFEQVPADPFNDPTGEKFGFSRYRMCTSMPSDICLAELEHQTGDDAVSERQRVRDVLAAS